MTARRSFNARQREAIFTAAGGVCHICGGLIGLKAWEVEHVLPLALGGSNEPDNLRPAHVACHAEKTAKADVPAIARAERLRLKHMGARPPSKFAARRAEALAWRRQKEAAQ